MKNQSVPNVKIMDLEPGLWILMLEHPAWNVGEDRLQLVTAVCVDAGGERWLSIRSFLPTALPNFGIGLPKSRPRR